MALFKFLHMKQHFNLESMSSILAIKYVASIPRVRISMDSKKELEIMVEYHNQIINFQECHEGLYYYDTSNKFISHNNSYSL